MSTVPPVPATGQLGGAGGISGIGGITGIGGLGGVSGADGLGGAGAAGASSSGFAGALSSGLDAVSGMQQSADAAVASLATGGSVQVADVMAATAKANLGITIVNEIRNRGLEAYQSILNVQV